MNARYPNPPLNQFVEMIWLMPGRQGGNSPEMALPTGTVELVIDLDFEQTTGFVGCDSNTPVMFRGPIVCGVHTQPFLIDSVKSGRTVGVHFKPGGAAGILPVGVHETENLQVELEAIAAPLSRQLRDLLYQAGDDDFLVLETMETFLTGLIHCKRHQIVTSSVIRLRDDFRPEVGTLVDGSGLSHRRFNELFRKEVFQGSPVSTGLAVHRKSRAFRLGGPGG